MPKMLPFNLPKATNEPVAVIPPMKVPTKAIALMKFGMSAVPAAIAGCMCMYSAMQVSEAATPTKEWNRATVCGKSCKSTYDKKQFIITAL